MRTGYPLGPLGRLASGKTGDRVGRRESCIAVRVLSGRRRPVAVATGHGKIDGAGARTASGSCGVCMFSSLFAAMPSEPGFVSGVRASPHRALDGYHDPARGCRLHRARATPAAPLRPILRPPHAANAPMSLRARP